MGNSPRILFVGEAATIAHVARPAILARWAREAGYDVHFACGSAYAEIPRQENLTLHDLHSVSRDHLLERVAKGRFFYREDELHECIAAERKLIATLQPDLVVGDFRLTLNISAALSGVPMVALLNAHWSPYGACRLPAPNGGIFRFLPHRPRQALMRKLTPIGLRWFAAPTLNRVRRKYGLEPLHDARLHYAAGDHCAYLDLPEFHPLAGLPDNHSFLGPLPWHPPMSTAPALDRLDRSLPLVYVTVGGSGDRSVLPQVLRALSMIQVEVVVSGIDPVRDAEVLRLCPQAQAFPLLNPIALLARAALTVCHGGSGTVYQSLAAGVPVLSLPGNPDQGLVAADAERAGCGLTIETYRAEESALLVAVASLVGERRYRLSAQKMATAMRFHDTRGRWLDLIAGMLGVGLHGRPADYAVTPACPRTYSTS